MQHGHSSGSSVNSTGSGAGGVGKSGNLRHSVSWSVPDGEFNEELDLEAGSSSVVKESTNEFVTNNENKPVSLARRSLTMAVSAVSEILK